MTQGIALVVAAFHTVGLSPIREFVERGRRLVATVRGHRSGQPADLARQSGPIRVEHLDTTEVATW